jgi:hypothetical protein
MFLTWRRGVRLIAAVLTVGIGAACERVEVVTGRPPSDVAYERRADAFAHGLIDGAAIPLPCEPAIIETRRTVGDWLIGTISLGVFTPRTVRVTCADDAVPLGGG